ncbi:hypothetical protein [Sphingomonas sp.]|jgi:hypothetical protein|uniref:hypothetical protein n=1 Tax=Sphingomonas sp. TaxID=28214 RepID=UPI002E377A40|nr:hypothetical protein [Sphingomonas sp.]HEX4693685.1 hypothetical protein [Sphingomonas sp.]
MSALLAFAFVASVSGEPAATRLDAAKAYVQAIYRRIPGKFNYRLVRYVPELRRLIERDDAAAKGEIGAIDAVPFCDCQDTATNYRVLRTSVESTPRGGARVTTFLRNDKVGRFVVDLVSTRGRWAVADIHTPDMPSFLAMMRREVSREENLARPRRSQ